MSYRMLDAARHYALLILLLSSFALGGAVGFAFCLFARPFAE
jgi:hypothetical protein